MDPGAWPTGDPAWLCQDGLVSETIDLHWFLPTGGDSRDVLPAADGNRRAPTREYLSQVARAADTLGYVGLLTPCGTQCEDAWLATAALIGDTARVKFLVAFRPGLLSPTLAAQMASTYQRMAGGRLLLNIVTGAEVTEMGRFGDWLDKDTRYRRAGEFLEIMKAAWGPEPIDRETEHYRVAAATTRAIPDPLPPVYFGGASPLAEQIAAEHVDVYLAWGEPPDMVRERLDRMRSLAAGHRRELRFGIRFHVITRDTAAEAWAVADRILASMDPAAIASAQEEFARTASVGQQRMAALHGGSTDRLEIHPNVWAGIGLVRGGAGTALVGSHAEVAERIAEYHELGFDEFILSGYPHLEEAYWFGEGVMPILRDRGLLPPDPSGPAEQVVSTFR
jgi:alkanesulfonate monooxygenase